MLAYHIREKSQHNKREVPVDSSGLEAMAEKCEYRDYSFGSEVSERVAAVFPLSCPPAGLRHSPSSANLFTTPAGQSLTHGDGKLCTVRILFLFNFISNKNLEQRALLLIP